MGQPEFRPRRADVELSADCRARVAEVIRAHDDDQTSLAQFIDVAADFAGWIWSRPEPERLEAAAQIAEVSARALSGRRGLVAVGWLTA
jgi:hypothetical protein